MARQPRARAPATPGRCGRGRALGRARAIRRGRAHPPDRFFFRARDPSRFGRADAPWCGGGRGLARAASACQETPKTSTPRRSRAQAAGASRGRGARGRPRKPRPRPAPSGRTHRARHRGRAASPEIRRPVIDERQWSTFRFRPVGHRAHNRRKGLSPGRRHPEVSKAPPARARRHIGAGRPLESCGIPLNPT